LLLLEASMAVRLFHLGSSPHLTVWCPVTVRLTPTTFSYSSLFSTHLAAYKWQRHKPPASPIHLHLHFHFHAQTWQVTRRRPIPSAAAAAVTMQRLARVLVVLVVAAATASAQGPTAAPATPTPATPAAPAPKAATTTTTSSNITGVLAKGGQFNTFIRLLKSTGVASQIDNQVSNGGNGITVFAPTDNAFTSLPAGTLNSLSDQDKNALVQYHVVSTAIPMSQFDTVSNPLRTQAGSASPGEYPLNVTSEGQQVNITTGVVNATVANSLYSEDSLVVYQVDKVLLPQKLFGAAEAPAPAPLAPAKKKGKTPAAVADSPEAEAEASPDATTASLAPARLTTGGAGLAAALALAGVWWGL